MDVYYTHICKYRSITTGLRSTVRANKKWRQNSAMARIRHVGGGEKKNDINMRNSNVGIIEKKNFRLIMFIHIVEWFWKKMNYFVDK
jgi:hypothetical protein